jgi:hypothetical protein
MLVVLSAAALLFVVEAPRRETGLESVRGPRVLRVRPDRVRRVELVGGARRLTAVRTTSGWEVDGRPADEATVEALDALVTTLAGLRALDAFRPGDRTALGLDPPAATLAVFTDRRERRLALGVPNAAGNGLYVERLGHPRVFVVGTGMLSAIDRVFFQQRLADKTAD